jgi:ribonucleoside-diphosphate reductase alpha chain
MKIIRVTNWYRDGCRDGVLISAKKDCNCNNQTLTHDAPKRPKILKCDVKRFRNNKEKWVACVGLFGDDKQPYEVFTGPLEKLEIPDYVEEGEIIKNKITTTVKDEYTGEETEKKVSRYDFRYTDKDGNKVVIEGINAIFDQTLAGYGRLISGVLRHGMPIEYLISTIKNISFPEENVNSWKAGIIRALSSYIKEKEVQGEVCPECGAKIVRENGCKHCTSCGWSACG